MAKFTQVRCRCMYSTNARLFVVPLEQITSIIISVELTPEREISLSDFRCYLSIERASFLTWKLRLLEESVSSIRVLMQFNGTQFAIIRQIINPRQRESGASASTDREKHTNLRNSHIK